MLNLIIPLHLALLGLCVYALVRTMNRVAALGRDDATDVPDEAQMRDHLLLGGSFYANPNDPRGWVPKMVTWLPAGLTAGKTLNFRTPRNVYAFVGWIALTLASTASLLAQVGRLM